MLKTKNGGFYFEEFCFLSAQVLRATGDNVLLLLFTKRFRTKIQQVTQTAADSRGSSHWRALYIPLAANVDGTLLIASLEAADPGVFEWSADDGLGRHVARSLSTLLEKLRQDLLTHKYEFVEDCGLVERQSRPSPSKK
jgi:hypothetical protein